MKRSISMLLPVIILCSFLLPAVQFGATAADAADGTDKISEHLQEYMMTAEEDEIIPIKIWLKTPSDAEIEAMVVVEPSNTASPVDAVSEGIDAYIAAKRKVQEQVISGITASFAENYLEEDDEILFRGHFIPRITVKVHKSRIAMFASLDEVKRIDYGASVGAGRPVSTGHAYDSEKISEYLQEYLMIAEDDEIIPIKIWVKAPSDAEIETMIPVPMPDETSTAEEVDAYISAKRQVQQEVFSALTTAFAENYLDDKSEIIQSRFLPNLTVKVPKAEIAALAALDEVTQIDAAFGHDEQLSPHDPCEHEYRSVVTAPTCSEMGYTTHICDICGDCYRDAEVPALGHDWDEGAVTKEPTETEPGVRTFTCASCGETRTEDIPVLEPVVEPFCFDDVKDDKAFYFEPVCWAVEQNITNGTTSTTFSPDAGCTRGQVVTFLWRAAGEPEPTTAENPFKDVRETDYFCKAVAWAVEKGITRGTSADAFSPEMTCTRAQIVTFLYRAEGTPEIAKKSKPFHDVADGQYYADAVAWAVENGVTTGKSADTFAPDDTCTRGQVVTFLFRAAAK